jgi:hypothetical protein
VALRRSSARSSGSSRKRRSRGVRSSTRARWRHEHRALTSAAVTACCGPSSRTSTWSRRRRRRGTAGIVVER